jgi:hypothetical protein
VYVIFGRPDPQDVNLANVGTAGFAINGPTDSLSITLPALTSRGAVFGERLQSVSPEQMSKDVNDDGFDDIVIGDSAVSSGLNTALAPPTSSTATDNTTFDATALTAEGVHGPWNDPEPADRLLRGHHRRRHRRHHPRHPRGRPGRGRRRRPPRLASARAARASRCAAGSVAEAGTAFQHRPRPACPG